jgi:hypothetical protein
MRIGTTLIANKYPAGDYSKLRLRYVIVIGRDDDWRIVERSWYSCGLAPDEALRTI